ncbi:uncharacterized protein LOC110188018 [Drosophila serrata]|uniref:uncharacterized protein LOC110188018 n=1 Tax=Drosophila serrata TaxID=7274 RepID=UPI000A1CFA98|nr:uncharacterized protein LOC110188018 [Drosophila serrata]
MNNHKWTLVMNQIPLKYIITAPACLFMLFIFFYYCYLSVRECRRSRGRESTSLLGQIGEEQIQVY